MALRHEARYGGLYNKADGGSNARRGRRVQPRLWTRCNALRDRRSREGLRCTDFVRARPETRALRSDATSTAVKQARRDRRVVLAYDGDRGLHIIDVSDPIWPTVASRINTGWLAQGVALAGDTAYVAAGDVGGLRVIDVSNPSAPREVSFYDTPDDAYRVAVPGDNVYVADGWGGLIILRFLSRRVYLPSVLRGW